MVVVKFLAICLMASSSSSQQFLPVKGLKEGLAGDPADALASTLLKNARFDAESGDVKIYSQYESGVRDYHSPPSLSSNVVAAGAGHSAPPVHSRLSSGDIIAMKPVVETASLSRPKEWSEPITSLRKSDDSGLSSLKDGMKHLFQDMASSPRSKSEADWSDFQHDASSESTREVVKVFDRDAVIRQPVLQDAPHVSMPDEESSVPAYMDKLNKLRHKPAAGARWFKQPAKAAVHIESTTKTVHNQYDDYMQAHPRELNVTEVQAEVDRIQEEVEGTDSLAKSLVSQLKTEKKKEVARLQRPHLPTGEVKKQAVPESSALDSVHKGHKRVKKMLPIRPEDVRNVTEPVEEPEEIPQSTPLLRLPERRIPGLEEKKDAKEKRSEKHSLPDLFGMYASEGLVDAKGMDAILAAQGIKNTWNWKAFDKDGDSKLSEKEFANAMIVAQRFRVRKN